MKTYRNFVLTCILDSNELGRFGETYYAEVEEITTTGVLFWKKSVTRTRSVFRRFGEFWKFADTGEFTPGAIVESLSREYQERTGERC